MMTPHFLAHILRVFQKWLLRLARRSASSLTAFLSLLRQFSTCYSKAGVRRSTTQPCLSRGALPRPLETDIVEEPLHTCSSLLPPAEIQDVAREPLSPSDLPYETIFLPSRRIVRENTAMSLPETTIGYPGAAGVNRHDSRLSLTPSMGESPTRYATYTKQVRSRRVTIYNSVADPHSGFTDSVAVPLGLPSRAALVSDPVIGGHLIVLPCRDQEGPEQPGPEVSMVYESPPIGLLVAEEVRRHERYTPRSSLPSQIVVPALTVKFPTHDTAVPPGWTTLVHPQGSRYFVNAERRTFTQMNICDEEIYSDIQYFMDYLLHSLRNESEGLELDIAQVDLVIEPKVSTNPDTVVCCYYFANHRDRCLFWLDEYGTEDILSECNGVENLSHIRLAIQAQYWKHCDYFPCLCPITQNLVDEVKDMLIYAECDHLTSRHSTAPFDVIEIRDYISIIDKIKVHSSPQQSMQQCHTAIVIGRIMYAFSRNHFINSHGENCVRLAFEQTVHPYTPSLLIVIMAPLLFLDPVALVRELHTIFVDNTPSSERWNTFNLNLNGQLQDSTLLATVLLNANVGFLAINSVDAGGRSLIQAASYMSLVSSLGSMILGLLLVSHNRSMGQLGTILQTEVFLSGLGEKERRLERLAIIYSLPKTLLMWGMIFFFAAFSVHWWSPGDQTTRAVVGSVIMVALVMIMYGIIRAKFGGDRWWRPPVLLLAKIGMELSTYLADAGKHVMVFIGLRKAQDPRSDTEGIVLAPPSIPTHRFQTNAETNIPGRSASLPATPPHFQPELPIPDDHEHRPNSSILSVRSSQTTTFVGSPPQPHGDISTHSPSDPYTSSSSLPGPGSLQQNQETQPIPQSTAEARCEPDAAPAGEPGFSCIEEREVVKYTANVVEEPGEIEHPDP